MPQTFKLREMQLHDGAGRQVVLRVDDQGNLVLAELFDRTGAKLRHDKIDQYERLDLSVVIKDPKKKTDAVAVALRMCPYPDGHGGVMYLPC